MPLLYAMLQVDGHNLDPAMWLLHGLGPSPMGLKRY